MSAARRSVGESVCSWGIHSAIFAQCFSLLTCRMAPASRAESRSGAHDAARAWSRAPASLSASQHISAAIPCHCLRSSSVIPW